MSPQETIHLYSGLAAGIGAGLSPIPGSDAAVLVTLQTRLILSLADARGVSLSQVAAAELALTFGATMVGRAASQWVTAWIPGFGAVINATTAAALTEAVGWAALRWFDRTQASEPPEPEGWGPPRRGRAGEPRW